LYYPGWKALLADSLDMLGGAGFGLFALGQTVYKMVVLQMPHHEMSGNWTVSIVWRC